MRRSLLSSPAWRHCSTRQQQQLLRHTAATATAAANRSFSSSTPPAIHTTTTTTTTTTFDVLIVGGGVVGAALARQLALVATEIRVPLTIGVVEAGPGPAEDRTTTTASSRSNSIPPHPRSYALSPASLDLLGIDAVQAQAMGGPYDSMQVWEATHPASLLWTTEDLVVDDDDDDDDGGGHAVPPFLGCCIEDCLLQQHLWNELRHYNNGSSSINDGTSVHLMPHTQLQDIQFPSTRETGSGGGWVTGTAVTSNGNGNSTTHRQTLRTELLVAADGARSPIRSAAGIGVHRTEYGQTAVTCTVELATPPSASASTSYQRRAFQRFGPGGEPLALLPTRSPHHAVVVWSTTPAQAERYTKDAEHGKQAIVDLWNEYLQTGPQAPPPLVPQFPTLQLIVDTAQYGGALLGSSTDRFTIPPRMTRVASGQQLLTFPLAWQYANTNTTTDTTDRPVVLVGDAACTVHPLAGQGLNIGLHHSVRPLTQAIRKALLAGVPLTTYALRQQPSSSSSSLLLRPDQGIHAVQQLFAQRGSWAQNLKCLGLNAVQAVGPVRRALVRAACYGV